MKLVAAAAFLAVLLLVTGQGQAHFLPGTEHNRRHAITWAFCGTLKPCRDGQAAQRVFECESGPALWPWARNGQYLGFAQMGSWARAQTGWRWGIWAQARAASRLQSRFGWSQWSCAYIVGVL